MKAVFFLIFVFLTASALAQNDPIASRVAEDMIRNGAGHDDKVVMFVLDMTESMSPYYRDMVFRIRAIIEALSSDNYRAGFYAFSDYSPQSKAGYIKYLAPVDLRKKENRELFMSRLPSFIELRSGGDPPEDSLTAVYLSLRFLRKISDSGKEPKKLVVLFTDAPYHTMEIPGDMGSVIICYDQLLKELRKECVTVYSVTVDFDKLKNGQPLRNVDWKKIADRDFRSLSEKTGGLWFELQKK